MSFLPARSFGGRLLALVQPARDRRRLLPSVAVVFVACATVLAGCSSSGHPSSSGTSSTSPSGSGSSGAVANDTGTITFSWWGDASRAAGTQAAVKLFEQKHTGIKVQTWYSPFGDYEKKIATLTAGGSTPDLMTVDVGFVNEYAQRGLFADLGKFMPAALSLTGLDSKLTGAGKTNGTQYAVPMAQNTQAIVVDLTRLNEIGVPAPKPGWTWDDLKTWAQQITTKSNGKYYGFVDPGTLWPAFNSWSIQHGKYLYKDGKINFTSADLQSFWNMTTDLRTSKAATDAQLTATVDGLPTDEPLLKGRAVAEWDYDSLFTMYASGTKDQLALVPLPTVDGKSGMFGQPSMYLAVSSKSSHQQQAAELLNFLVNDPDAAKALGNSRGLFPNLDVRKTMAGQATGPIKTIYDYEAAAQSGFVAAPPPPPKGDNQLLTMMQRVYQQVAFGQLSVSQGADQFITQAKQIIGQ